MDVYPLIFEPIFKPKVWGGRRLETLLKKRLPEGERIGESWELADLDEEQSVAANGAVRGRTLRELVRDWGRALLGDTPLSAGLFPLMIKFLDATKSLSIQVHPNAEAAAGLGGGARAKEEAWYIVNAESGGHIYRGVRQGVNAEVLRQALERGDVEPVLNRIPVRKGHFHYLPGGTIHGLGAGVTVAEIQTPSDVTFRLYDWDRIDPSTGRVRELHVDKALRCVCYDDAGTSQGRPEHVAGIWRSVTGLLRCSSFIIERVRTCEGAEYDVPVGRLAVWLVLEGSASIAHEATGDTVRFGIGDTVLMPAGLKNARVRAHEECMWLEASVPETRGPV